MINRKTTTSRSMGLITSTGRTVGTILTKEIPRKLTHCVLSQFLELGKS